MNKRFAIACSGGVALFAAASAAQGSCGSAFCVLNTNWSTQFTQPLLRNFKIDTTRQQLVVTKLNQDISELQLQQTLNSIRSLQREQIVMRLVGRLQPK